MKKNLLIPTTLTQNNFDLFRFLLATSVIFCHCYAIYYGWERFAINEPFMRWSNGKISIGSAAVNFFFVISGFLIVRSFQRSNNFWDYLKKRILRIYPGFIVVFLLGFLFFGPIGHLKEWSLPSYGEFLSSVPLKREVANMVSLQSPIEQRYFTFLPQYGLNNSLWTIQYEFICYLLVPLFFWAIYKRPKALLLVSFFVAYGSLCLQSLGYIFPFKQELSGGIIGNPYYYPRFFTYFFSGALVYCFRTKIPRNTWVFIGFFVLFSMSFKWQSIDFIWPLTGTYLLFYMAYHPKLLFPNFARHGDFSYGIYLYGWPLQQLVMLWFWPYLNPFTFFLAVMPLVLLFAFLSWTLVEKPALKLKSAK